MTAFVVDENVLTVAEKSGADEYTTEENRLSCIAALRQAMNSMTVLDVSKIIIGQYFKQVKPIKKNRTGSEFLLWLWANQYVPEHCEQVSITKLGDSYAEVPLEIRMPDAAGKLFDLDDHKWLAVARASANSPTILNATDSDWLEWLVLLEKNGFVIRFLCPELMQPNRGFDA